MAVSMLALLLFATGVAVGCRLHRPEARGRELVRAPTAAATAGPAAAAAAPGLGQNSKLEVSTVSVEQRLAGPALLEEEAGGDGAVGVMVAAATATVAAAADEEGAATGGDREPARGRYESAEAAVEPSQLSTTGDEPAALEVATTAQQDQAEIPAAAWQAEPEPAAQQGPPAMEVGAVASLASRPARAAGRPTQVTGFCSTTSVVAELATAASSGSSSRAAERDLQLLQAEQDGDVHAAARLVAALTSRLDINPAELSPSERLQLVGMVLQAWQAQQARRFGETMAS